MCEGLVLCSVPSEGSCKEGRPKELSVGRDWVQVPLPASPVPLSLSFLICIVGLIPAIYTACLPCARPFLHIFDSLRAGTLLSSFRVEKEEAQKG